MKSSAKRIKNIDLGKLIRDRRKKLGLKVYELASKAMVNPVYITQIEKNLKIPSPSVFLNIAKNLDSNPYDIELLARIYLSKKYPAIYEMVYYSTRSTLFSSARIFDEFILWGDFDKIPANDLKKLKKLYKKRGAGRRKRD